MRHFKICLLLLTAISWSLPSDLFARGFGGGGGGFRGGGGGGFHGGGGGGFSGGGGGGFAGGGGFHGGGGMGGGGFSGGAGFSGGGFHPNQGSFSGQGFSGQGFSGQGRSPGFESGNRPSMGSRDLSGGVDRPNVTHFPNSNLELRPGSRPQINPGGGITRTDLSPGDRPRISTRPGEGGAGTRFPGEAGGGIRPGAGGAGIRPGEGSGTARLPGLGPSRPGAGGAGERFNPSASNHDRHQDLNSRFDDMQNHWGDPGWHHDQWNGPNGGQVNHIGFWGPNGYWGHTGAWGPNGGHWGHTGGITSGGAWGHTNAWGPAGHWSRNWGGWYNGYGPAWGNGRWNYLWDRYPVAMAFGATMWGMNAVAWTFGVGAYYNPYCDGPVYFDNQQVVSYTDPVVGDPAYNDQGTASADPDQATDPASGDAAVDPLTDLFNQARSAFYNEQFDEALKLTDQALVKAPRDAAINEFRSLCLFALGRYRESAANIHAVLAAGPGWDWTTLITLYAKPDTYTDQLRKLEAFIKENPKSADARFLLAYHYITCDHKDLAVKFLKSVVQLQPQDKLAADLVQIYSPASDEPAPAPAPDSAPPAVDKPAYPMEKLQGTWRARSDDGEFELTLGTEDDFTWKFTRDDQPQSVSGAYTVRGNNLVMEPKTGGVMLSDIQLSNDKTLVFSPVGEGKKLTFTK